MKISRRRWMTLAIISIPLLFLLVEFVQFLSNRQDVVIATQNAIRYAVTGEYDPEYCISECQTKTEQNEARLLSIQAIAYDALSEGLDTGFRSTQPENVRVAVCSNRTGYRFYQATSQCLPRDDPGESGSEVLVSTTYDHQFGSFFGAPVTILPIQITRSGIIESFRVARLDGLPEVINLSSPSDLLWQERLIVVHADLQLVVDDVESSLNFISSLARDVGGYVVQSEMWNDRGSQQARLQVRIPDDEFQTVLDQARTSAKHTLRDTVSRQDVTEEYVDLEARLQSLRATKAQIQLLLEQAQNVEEALQVNVELGNLDEKIESIVGRMQYLENQVVMATMTISLTSDQSLLSSTTLSWEPSKSFAQAASFLLSLLKFLGNVVIWTLVVGIPLFIFAWLIWRVVVRFKKS
jgi:hypothetical protein